MRPQSVEILLTWRCSVPEGSAERFLSDFGEEVIVPKHAAGNGSNRFFNVGIDDDEHDIVIEAARSFLSRNSTKLRELIELGGSSHFDFALLVGAEHSYAPSVLFEPTFLAELATHRVDLRVSAYPVSDQAE